MRRMSELSYGDGDCHQCCIRDGSKTEVIIGESGGVVTTLDLSMRPLAQSLESEIKSQFGIIDKRLDQMGAQVIQLSSQLCSISTQMARKLNDLAMQINRIQACVEEISEGPTTISMGVQQAAQGFTERRPSDASVLADGGKKGPRLTAQRLSERQNLDIKLRAAEDVDMLGSNHALARNEPVEKTPDARKEVGDDNGEVDGDARSSPKADANKAPSMRSGASAPSSSARGRRKLSPFAIKIWKFLEDPESSWGAYVYARFHSLFVVAGVTLILSQTVDPPPLQGTYATVLDIAFDALLMVEVLVRFTVCPMTHTRFFQSGFNIIDILTTVLPLSLRIAHGFTNPVRGGNNQSFEMQLLFCCVPLLRLLKILRRFQKYQLLTHSFWLVFEALPVLIFTFIVIALIFSSAIYLVEPRDNIPTIPDAVWMVVVTMTTVGYGDSVPESLAGHVVIIVLMIGSALYMAMPIGIVGQAFNSVWADRDRILLMKRTRNKIEEWGFQASDIPALFKQFDVDGNGELDLEEFRQLMAEMGIGLPDMRVVELFESFDNDNSGTIDDKEFLRRLFPSDWHRMYIKELHDNDDGSGQPAPQAARSFFPSRLLFSTRSCDSMQSGSLGSSDNALRGRDVAHNDHD